MRAILTFLAVLFLLPAMQSQDIPDSLKMDDDEHLLLIDTTIKADISIGLELQGYPTGVIPGLHIDVTFNNRNALIFRLGYNWFNHRDLGIHDKETGSGVGVSFGYRRYFEEEGLKGFFIGLRSDLWINKVDWSEHVDNDRKIQEGKLESKSDVVVIQPVLEVGYKVKSPDSRFAFVPFIGLGYEWNVSEQGHEILQDPLTFPDDANLSPETGDGFIFLAGFAFTVNVGRSDQRRWSDR